MEVTRTPRKFPYVPTEAEIRAFCNAVWKARRPRCHRDQDPALHRRLGRRARPDRDRRRRRTAGPSRETSSSRARPRLCGAAATDLARPGGPDQRGGRAGPGSCLAWWHGSSRAGRTGPGRQARVPARDLHGRDGPAPGVILKASASPPMTGGARPRSLPGRKRNSTGRHRGLDGLNLNVPGGKLTGLVVTRPGEPARPRRRRKGHESHRRGAERQCDHRQRLRSQPRSRRRPRSQSSLVRIPG